MSHFLSQLKTSTVERSVSLAVAEKRVREALNGLGLRPLLEECEEEKSKPSACHCILVKSDGTVPREGKGSGKGLRDEARVGALYEALEHLLTGPEYLGKRETYLRKVDHFKDGALLPEASIALLTSKPGAEVICCSYADLNSSDHIDVPLYLSSPWYVEESGREIRKLLGDSFDYREVARYSLNSGSAIGVTESEATVHALNEVIERDAFSLLLIQSYFGKKKPPNLVDPGSLPADISQLLSYVESLIGERVYLLDMTTEVDIPAYQAYVPPNPERLHLRGAGASLSPHYAAYRAISELLQCFLLKGGFGHPDSFAHLEPLRKYPPLFECGLFDLTQVLPNARSVVFQDRSFPIGPDAHRAELLRRVHCAGFSVYQHKVVSLENGINVVHVLVPGMEHFMAVYHGLVIAPGERGINAVQR